MIVVDDNGNDDDDDETDDDDEPTTRPYTNASIAKANIRMYISMAELTVSFISTLLTHFNENKSKKDNEKEWKKQHTRFNNSNIFRERNGNKKLVFEIRIWIRIYKEFKNYNKMKRLLNGEMLHTIRSRARETNDQNEMIFLAEIEAKQTYNTLWANFTPPKKQTHFNQDFNSNANQLVVHDCFVSFPRSS